MENLPPACGVNYQLLNEQLPVAVKHSQIRTMAPETVGSIDRSLPPTHHTAVHSELALLWCECGPYKSQDLVTHWDANAQPLECQATTLFVRPLWE